MYIYMYCVHVEILYTCIHVHSFLIWFLVRDVYDHSGNGEQIQRNLKRKPNTRWGRPVPLHPSHGFRIKAPPPNVPIPNTQKPTAKITAKLLQIGMFKITIEKHPKMLVRAIRIIRKLSLA